MMEAKIDIEKVRKGDHAAFKTFFEWFYPKLMALACRFVDEQVAKDLVQEVFASLRRVSLFGASPPTPTMSLGLLLIRICGKS